MACVLVLPFLVLLQTELSNGQADLEKIEDETQKAPKIPGQVAGPETLRVYVSSSLEYPELALRDLGPAVNRQPGFRRGGHVEHLHVHTRCESTNVAYLKLWMYVRSTFLKPCAISMWQHIKLVKTPMVRCEPLTVL